MTDARTTQQSNGQWRPSKEVELIVGTPPGGGQDRPARAMIRIMETSGLIDVPMRVTNIAGKGGGNAWSAVRERPRDAHVLSVSSAPLITNSVLGVSDFDHTALTPIATLYTEYLAFVVRADSKLQTGADLLARLAADPGALAISIATAIGTTNHIALGQIVQHLGGDPKRLNLRVFESALYAVDDVVEGKADAGVISAVSAVKALEAGRLRPLAVSAPARLGGVFANAPTWTEQGVPCAIGQWRGIIGAEGISEAQIAYWEQAFAAAVASPTWKAEIDQYHWTDTWKGSAATRELLDAERVFLGSMLKGLGLIEGKR
jgi:putative tricarboxylic transport membrane protein